MSYSTIKTFILFRYVTEGFPRRTNIPATTQETALWPNN